MDVDGARAIGAMLKVNSSLNMLDIGHNRIRITGLKSVVDGALANPTSGLKQLAIRANFINDDGFSYLFEKMVFGNKQSLTHVFLNENFLSEFHKLALYRQAKDKAITIYADGFESCDLMSKDKLDKSIWISPMPKSY